MRSIRAFQNMWVAGTLGAFFTAFARNVPLHLQEGVGPPVDWEYTFDILLRFHYAAWFLVYFFVSNLDNEAADSPDPRSVAFDVLQSFASLWAVFWLGFALPGHGFGVDQAGEAFAAANGAVAAICLLSWLFFRESTPHLNYLRLLGLAVSIIAVFVGLFVRPQFLVLEIGWPIFLVLAGLLGCYWWFRKPPAEGATLRQIEMRVKDLEARFP